MRIPPKPERDAATHEHNTRLNSPPLSPNRQKHTRLHHAIEALRADLRERDWRDRRGEFHYEFQSKPLQDREVSSPLFGPLMRTIQWEPSSK